MAEVRLIDANELLELYANSEELDLDYCFVPVPVVRQNILDIPTVDPESLRQQWISVEDRLPEQGERVLFTDGAWVGEGYINKRGKWQRYVNQSYLDVMTMDVTHWMPLPEPPEED